MTKAKDIGGFGFRELQDFNSGLLTNMVERVMNEPGNLWVQVLKGLYFPSSGFMHAARGADPRGGGLALSMGETTFERMGCGQLATADP